MALEVAAAIIGILAAAGNVAETLGPYVLAWKHAPENAAAILSEVNASRVCLSALQRLLDDLDSSPRSRKSLIQIDHLIATFTDGVLLFSELEAMITDIKGNRTQWAWSDKKITGIVSRLQCFKGSISVMLNILQCASDQEAIHSGQELLAITTSLLQNNLDLSRRMARLEDHLIKDSSIDTSRPASVATTTFRLHNEFNTGRSNTKWIAPLSKRWVFESDLMRSRVYQKAKRSTCDDSFRSSAVASHAWSALSSMSLSDISAVSVVALPVEWTEISVRQHYKDYEIPRPNQPVKTHGNMDSTDSLSSSISTIREYRSRTKIQLIVNGTTDAGTEDFVRIWAKKRFKPSTYSYASVALSDTAHYRHLCVQDGNPVSFSIDVICGLPFLYEEGSSSIWKGYIERGELFILVFSVESRYSLYYILFNQTEIVRKQGFAPHSILLVATHFDDPLMESELQVFREGEQLAERLGCSIIKIGKGISVKDWWHHLQNLLNRDVVFRDDMKQQEAIR